MKRSRGGFLSTEKRQRLLHITNWPEETQEDEIYRYFYDIREHAKAAIDDFRLLSEVLNEEEFQKIFGEKMVDDQNRERYPISVLFEVLIPKTVHLKEGTVVTEILKKQEWRKHVLDEITVKSLLWYVNSGIIQTDAHRRLLIDAADIIAVQSSGRKLWWYRQDSQIPDIV